MKEIITYLPTIEWEALQEKKYIIKNIITPEFLKPCVEKIEVYRDEDYNITASIYGNFEYNTFDLPSEDKTAWFEITEKVIDKLKNETDINTEKLNTKSILNKVFLEKEFITKLENKGFKSEEISKILEYARETIKIYPLIEIEGVNYYGGNIEKEKYYLKPYSLPDVNRTYKQADLPLVEIKKNYNLTNLKAPEVKWHTEWYVNSPQSSSSFFTRSTSRKSIKKYIRNRDINVRPVSNPMREWEEKDVISQEISCGFSRDYAYINLKSSVDIVIKNIFAIILGIISQSIPLQLTVNWYKLLNPNFIIHEVPSGIVPDWSKKIGIEYRKDFGRIPDSKEREAIREIVSFIMGRNLLNVGYTQFNEDAVAIEEVAARPGIEHIKRICGRGDFPPIRIDSHKEPYQFELLLQGLIPKYLNLRFKVNLPHSLWIYWRAFVLPIDVKLPMLGRAVEILADAWFEYKNDRSSNCYISKRDFDELLGDEFASIDKKLKDKNIPYRERIMNRITGAYTYGSNEKIEIQFFKKIGLPVGDIERKAIRARNIIHNKMLYEEHNKMFKLIPAYETLFHRIILKILGYEGKYVDYYTYGCPERPLDEPVGGQ